MKVMTSSSSRVIVMRPFRKPLTAPRPGVGGRVDESFLPSPLLGRWRPYERPARKYGRVSHVLICTSLACSMDHHGPCMTGPRVIHATMMTQTLLNGDNRDDATSIYTIGVVVRRHRRPPIDIGNTTSTHHGHTINIASIWVVEK